MLAGDHAELDVPCSAMRGIWLNPVVIIVTTIEHMYNYTILLRVFQMQPTMHLR